MNLPLTLDNKHCMVTGADGFIGSHLTRSLLDLGARVTVVVRRVSRSQVTHDFENLRHCARHPALSVMTVDLAGPAAQRCLLASEAEHWFHLAADAYVPASFSQPSAVVLNNITSTLNVLEAANQARPKNVIIISSSEVYGPSNGPIAETHALNPTSPYAASKAACDRLAWSYWQTYKTPLTVVRPFNTYGPRHVYDVVPLFIRLALEGKPLTIHGDGNQTRDLTYVDDHVAALLALATRPGVGEVFNVGTGNDYSVLQIAQAIKEATGSSSPIVFGPPRTSEVFKLQADASLLRRATGWEPRVALAEGIRRNVEWARAHWMKS